MTTNDFAVHNVTLQRWAEVNPPTEAAIRARLHAEGLAGYAWSNDAFEVYSQHTHPYHKVIYVVHGSIRFELNASGGTLELLAGDRVFLPAHVLHAAIVGEAGVLCYEAQLQA